LPRAGTELDEEHNPLEAGLRDAVNFSKGCYVGQEVVARLETYDKVSRRLMVVRPSDSATRAPVSGDTLTREGRAIGSITSAAVVPGGTAWIALAYVKRSRGEHGSAVGIGGDERDGGRGVVLNPPVDPLG
jgi:folate-binding protein YgfZ